MVHPRRRVAGGWGSAEVTLDGQVVHSEEMPEQGRGSSSRWSQVHAACERFDAPLEAALWWEARARTWRVRVGMGDTGTKREREDKPGRAPYDHCALARALFAFALSPSLRGARAARNLLDLGATEGELKLPRKLWAHTH